MQNEQKKIALVPAIIVGVNAMIGAGVLAMPAVLARNVGPASIFSFLISIGIVLCIGLSLGRAAELFPGEGWNYVYPSQWAGHKVGLISSYSYLIGVVIAMGFLVQQAGIWLHKFIPALSPSVLSALTLGLLTGLVVKGATVSVLGQYFIAGMVVVPLLLTSVVCWLNFNPALLKPFMPGGVYAVFDALPQALFGLLGFEAVASLYTVVENPRRNVPRAFIAAIVIVGLVYLIFVCGVLFSIPRAFFQSGLSETLAAVLARVFPDQRFLSTAVLIGATFGIIGTLHSMIWSLSALLTDILGKMNSSIVRRAMQDGIWNPTLSVFTVAGCMHIVSCMATPEWLISLTSVCLVPSYILSLMALIFLKQEWRSGRNIITIIAIAGGILLLYFAVQATFLAVLYKR